MNTWFNKSSKALALITALLLVSFSMTVNAGGHKSADPGDIVEVAAGAGSFNTLVAAVQAAGLVDALKGDGPLTVFAPTDDAFAALPDGTLDSLLKPENKEQLKAILLYHVVSGKVMYADIKGTVNAETLEGSTIEIVSNGAWSKANKKVTVNGANIVKPDVAASNGVIHVIDAVLLPPRD
ncbi:MAG: fasciclin domain-containing protein [Gammaproteobacteria bacterium]|nr:fasciclin domain-containing protein [Gammaproteobacteria bacterium]